jgi:hypothetical protein
VEGKMEEIQRLRYQIKMLSEALLDAEQYPLQHLIISLNWGEQDLDAADDIFEEYDKILKDKSVEIPLAGFEQKLKERFRIGYQTVKQIILAFYYCGKWVDVCKAYAKANDVSEFRPINHPKSQ